MFQNEAVPLDEANASLLLFAPFSTPFPRYEVVITPEAEMIATLGLNSLELADLIVMCEDRFVIVFEDEDLASLITLGDVAAYIEARA